LKENQIVKNMTDWLLSLKKYRYAAFILILGIGLMVIPQGKKEQQEITQTEPQYDDVETRLEELLGKIEGAGKVDVMMTLEEGSKYTYQTDDQYYSDSSEQEREETTVLISNGDGTESAVVIGMRYPTYMGAVVVCEGADRALVKLSIVNAVSDLTGLSSDKISVIKMNES